MPKKIKTENVHKLEFKDLQDKLKDQPDFKTLNRFQLTQAYLAAQGKTEAGDKVVNPKTVKERINSLREKVANAEAGPFKIQLRRHISRLKRQTRWAQDK